ncbi:glycine cleavage system aminomethyltransferase GcvT [Ruminococcaceae bacterium OttesenSCG-928-A16]|nr:glycine cleavage system aminomethyltransferase GcvT [Ruminococcaceae bacterium OttesenSCG-928-A16]
MEKKTALYENHLAAGGKMVPFAGYLMPVQYPTGVIAEHMAVRTAAGLFDVSHMGELLISGTGALPFLQQLLTNNMEGMANGDCRYSPMCNKAGGVVDDLIVYRYSQHLYLLVVNAANLQKDIDWIKAHLPVDVDMTDNSGNISELALQGPKAEAILAKVADKAALPVKPYTFVGQMDVAGIECIVSRTGYTGEDGFELYCATENGPLLWDALLAAGKEEGLIPCGLGARDTLRLEAGMPLYGHEMDDVITPREAALSFFVKMDKPDFIGKAALEEKGEPARRRTGLKMVGRGIAREGCAVYSQNGEEIGVVTSGTQLPFVGYAGAMALLPNQYREPGTLVEVDVRGRRVEAEVIKLPFYRRASK